MAPTPLSHAPSISFSARTLASSFSRRSRAPPPAMRSHVARAVESILPSTALLSRAVNHIKRQTSGIVAIPTTYQGLNAGPSPGTVVGITLGAVAGFILVMLLIYVAITKTAARTTIIDEEVIHRHHAARSVSSVPPPRRTRSRRHRSRSHSAEVTEIRERSRPRRTTSERIIVEEVRSPSVAPPPPAPVDDEDDIVEVIEEHSPPRRRSRRESGYRTVDPDEYGGGGRPLRKVRR